LDGPGSIRETKIEGVAVLANTIADET